MNQTKNLTGPCRHCGGTIEYPAHLIGTTRQCPYCGKPTELLLATPPVEPAFSRKAVLWAIIGGLILIVGLGVPLLGLHWVQGQKQRLANQPHPVLDNTNRTNTTNGTD